MEKKQEQISLCMALLVDRMNRYNQILKKLKKQISPDYIFSIDFGNASSCRNLLRMPYCIKSSEYEKVPYTIQKFSCHIVNSIYIYHGWK